MKNFLTATLLVALSGGVAVAEDETEVEIATYDTDNDGLLSKQEVASHQEISARFEELDANGDGLLGEDELDSGPIDDFDEIGEDPVDEEM